MTKKISLEDFIRANPDMSNAEIVKARGASLGSIYSARWRIKRDAKINLVRKTEPEATTPDMVNHPPHYTDGGIETIDYIQAKLTPDEFRGFCRGNAIKYISRAGKKGSAVEDIAKAAWYISRLDGVVR